MKSNYKKRLVLFDAHAILHRAYHALPDFVSAGGEPTGGLFGLSAMLLRIFSDLKPDYMVACYDLAEPTFRKKVYDEYKAGRAKADDALVAQMTRSQDIFTAFQIPVFSAPGFEADDIIGTIVEQIKNNKDLEVIIASGDMDTMQLVVGNKVRVYTLKKGINDTVIYDEKAVVERFGFEPEYLPDFKGLSGDQSDNIIGIKGIGEKTATTLIAKFGTIENIYKQLVKNDKKILEAGLSPRIITLLREGEEEALFSKTLATIRRDAPVDFVVPEKTWSETFNIAGVEKIFNELDFRTLLARARTAFGAKGDTKEEVVVKEEVDALLFKQAQIMLWLLDSEKNNSDLDQIYSHTKTEKFADAFKKLKQEIIDKKLDSVYQNIELPLIPILERAERRGILIDKKCFIDLSKELHLKLVKLEKEIFNLAGHEFNINSPKQLGVVLFDELKLTAKGLKKTAGGARSTKESELLKLASEAPIVDFILKYRELAKLVSTYVDTIPKLVDDNSRLHSKLNQTGTTTGRMSSTDPNLQNIPASDSYGVDIRRGFVVTPGHILVAADYSQIELRVLAMLSGDPVLRDIFKSGKDIHTSVAARIFDVKESDVTYEMRRKAKVVNFGIIYGMGVNALRVNLGSTREEAQKFYDGYFEEFNVVKKYFDQVVQDAYSLGYTETMFGRRRYYPGLKSKLPFIRAQAERQAGNAPIQGTEADIVKIATIKVEEALAKAKLQNQAHFLLQVHDELIYEVEEGVLDKVLPIINKEMTGVVQNDIPILVNVEIGPNWGDLEPWQG
ncbi:MAG: polymerase [Patescibacteria group bacterium]|nr:polymerase [Patescibacteria group bacterium]